MPQARHAIACWLGQSGRANSRIEALYQAVEDQDMTTIRAMLEGAWRAGYAASPPAHLASQRALTGDGIGGRDE